jgi:HAD superfamily hydrolase (TIGR01509 family)
MQNESPTDRAARLGLGRRRHWIFDMDGTLTHAIHDFAAIKAEMGLPTDRPILEVLAEMPAAKAEAKREQLARIEREIAGRSTASPGSRELLEELGERGCRLGIVTRNSRENALHTLEAAGLGGIFGLENIMGRDEATPKPDPAAILELIHRWGGTPDDAVMVGDFRFDLVAGRAAGAATVYIDPSGDFPYRDDADVSIRSLEELRRLL